MHKGGLSRSHATPAISHSECPHWLSGAVLNDEPCFLLVTCKWFLNTRDLFPNCTFGCFTHLSHHHLWSERKYNTCVIFWKIAIFLLACVCTVTLFPLCCHSGLEMVTWWKWCADPICIGFNTQESSATLPPSLLPPSGRSGAALRLRCLHSSLIPPVFDLPCSKLFFPQFREGEKKGGAGGTIVPIGSIIPQSSVNLLSPQHRAGGLAPVCSC